MSIRLSSKFTFKGKISEEKRSLLYYKLYSSCNATYRGKTRRHFKVCFSEHMRVSARQTSKSQVYKNFAVCDHILVCNNTVYFENFSFFANGNNDFRIKLQESLLILRDGPQLTRISDILSNDIIVVLFPYVC